jgi:hypothetical protein
MWIPDFVGRQTGTESNYTEVSLKDLLRRLLMEDEKEFPAA